MSEADYGLILSFDSDDEEFCRGFEAGRIYEQIKDGEPFTQMIHASNTEMAMRICETAGRSFRAEQVDDEWTDLTVDACEAI
jgi:hypothetical protein